LQGGLHGFKKIVQNGDGAQSIYNANTTEFSSLKHALSLTMVSGQPHPIPLQINKFCATYC